MHINSKHLEMVTLARILREAKDSGIVNILAKDDVALYRDKQSLEETAQLVRTIRRLHGEHFCIGVMAYPEGTRDTVTEEEDIRDLMEVLSAGVDFIITAPFFDVHRCIGWLRRLQAAGVTCPIIPGIMHIHSWQHFLQMTKMTPRLDREGEWRRIHDDLRLIRHSEEAVKEYGVAEVIRTIRHLQANGWPGVYFYTLNLEKAVTEIVARITVPEDVRRAAEEAASSTPAPYPRPQSPLKVLPRPPRIPPKQRSFTWDDFPNGRWGDAASPAFACNDLAAAPFECKGLWSNVRNLDDVIDVFCAFLKGEIDALPWFNLPLAEESRFILDHLLRLNRNGFLTIASQPRVDGASAKDPVHGWGPAPGTVFQREFLEFFCSAAKVRLLLKALEPNDADEHPKVMYVMTNCSGTHYYHNFDSLNVLSWGVFPRSMVLQPTMFDPDAFMMWKSEAFALWTQHFGPDEEIPSVIKEIQEQWFLVNIVNNDYKNPPWLWDLFETVMAHPDFDVHARGSTLTLPRSLREATPRDLLLLQEGFVDDMSSQHAARSLCTMSSSSALLDTSSEIPSGVLSL